MIFIFGAQSCLMVALVVWPMSVWNTKIFRIQDRCLWLVILKFSQKFFWDSWILVYCQFKSYFTFVTKKKLYFSLTCCFCCCLVKKQFAIRGLVAYKKSVYQLIKWYSFPWSWWKNTISVLFGTDYKDWIYCSYGICCLFCLNTFCEKVGWGGQAPLAPTPPTPFTKFWKSCEIWKSKNVFIKFDDTQITNAP